MKPSDDYYYQLDAAHQREVDWQAGYEIALDEVATEIDNDLKQGDKTHYHELTEMLCDNDNFWLAIGSGASYESYRQEAIKKIAERELNARMNDYDQDSKGNYYVRSDSIHRKPCAFNQYYRL